MKYQVGEIVYTSKYGYNENYLGVVELYDGTDRPYLVRYLEKVGSAGAEMDHWVTRWPDLVGQLTKIHEKNGDDARYGWFKETEILQRNKSLEEILYELQVR